MWQQAAHVDKGLENWGVHRRRCCLTDLAHVYMPLRLFSEFAFPALVTKLPHHLESLVVHFYKDNEVAQ